MSPQRISLALALLPHAGYPEATAVHLREFLLEALGDHSICAVAFPDVASASEIVGGIIGGIITEMALEPSGEVPPVVTHTHECVAAYGIDGDLLAVSTSDLGLATEIRKLGYDLVGCLTAGEMSVYRITLQIPRLRTPGTETG
jgi:hypothetical protein